MKDNNRSTNIELYRIILIILIIAHHYVVNSGLIDLIYNKPITLNSIFLIIFGAWGKVGINCFVLITGYYMYNKEIKIKKIIKLVCEVLFYNLVISGVFLIFHYNGFSIRDFVKSLAIFDGISNNFTNCYLLFYLLIPFINILIKNLNKKMHLLLILILVFIYSFISIIPNITISFNYITWFSVIYLIGSYLHKYVITRKIKWSLYLVISLCLSIASVIVGLYLSAILDKKIAYYFVNDSNKILALTTSICLFMCFINMRIRNIRIINFISSSVFGVLLIHANSDIMRHFLWKGVLKNTEFFNSSFLIFHAFLSVIGIFIICTIIDKIRIILIETPFFKLLDSRINKIDNKITEFLKTEVKL